MTIGVQDESRRTAVLQHPRELAAADQRQETLRRPERDSGGAGPGALEADLAEVQVLRAEVGVRRFVPVMYADRRIPEQHTAAAVWLQSVLVRVDDQ